MGRRKFSREFKLEAVRLVRDRGVAVAQACRDLKAAGCFVEIIQYQARVFVPIDVGLRPEHVAALGRVLTMLPVRFA